MPFVWNARLNTNIRVIDEQHRRIVDYINDLERANLTADRQMIAEAIAGVTDYTQSHFSFEESLLEEAGYRFLKPHKKVHELFIRRIESYAVRHNKGENVGEELYNLLSSWLVNHIQHDDADYVASVKDRVEGAINRRQKEGNWFTRFLRGKAGKER